MHWMTAVCHNMPVRRPLGQHFLFDPNILKRIIDSSGITPEDTVLEIGPGLGTMTRLLAHYAGKVIAIEVDSRLSERLKETLSSAANVEIINADALKYPFNDISGKFKVVANIPYYITTPLLFRFLEFKERIPSMTLLMQKEVAERIVAKPGRKDYGVLSITAQLYTRPEIKFIVSRGTFSPPPRVDSALVHFEVSGEPIYKIKDERLFLKVVKTAFSQRRKTILNTLKSYAGIKEALDRAGIDPKLRPENLSIEDFIKIADALSRSF
ncbi:MAG: ribosomal RNA small subunit methyltransferase A [Nitrospirae bacterium]|nr:ribosomal RNA small subunit methyltransferase A [Nitrospirota bacterium]